MPVKILLDWTKTFWTWVKRHNFVDKFDRFFYTREFLFKLFDKMVRIKELWKWSTPIPHIACILFFEKKYISGTVLMIQLMQNSPTCAYISQNQHKWKPHHWQPHYAGTSCPVLHFHNSFMFIILSKIEQKFSCVAKSVKFVDKSVPFDPCPKSLGPVQKHCT